MKKTLTLIILAFLAFSLNAQTLKTITWGEQQRDYYEYVPSTYTGDTPAPVLVMLHGMGDQAADILNVTNFMAMADEKGWILLCPQALEFVFEIPFAGSYNFGTCWAAGITLNVTFTLYGMPLNFDITVNGDVDDSGFLCALLDATESAYNIDQDSIFFAGFSLGACMSHRLAIEHGDRINAIAAVSGVVGNDMQALSPTANVNVLEIFGTNDEVISYDNAEISVETYGSYSIGLPAEATVEYWRGFNQCDEEAIVEQYPDTQNDGLTFEMHSYQNGSNGSRIGFLKVNGGQHSWYSGTSYDIDYGAEIIKFFTNTLDVTDLNESTEPALAIYPNPSRDIIQLDTDDEVFIYDINGRMVLQGSGKLDVSGLPDGLYFVKTGDTCTKLIINKE